MRARAWVAVAAVLVGCGSITCELEGLDVRLETGALCGQAEQSVLRARLMLASANVVPAEDFSDVYAGLDVRVVDADAVTGGIPSGYWTPAMEGGERIELNRYGASLLHELLHAKESRTGTANEADPHAGWEARGWRALDAEFKADAPSLDR